MRPFRATNKATQALFLLLIVIAFSTGGLHASPDPHSGGLLKNGTFAGAPGKRIARGWGDNSGWSDLAVSYEIVPGPGSDGTAQKIHCSNLASGAVQFVQKGVSIGRGRTYRLMVSMKGDLESPVEIMLRKQGQPYTTYVSKAFKVSDRWREYSFVGYSSAEDRNCFFMIRFADTGTLYLADAGLRDITGEITEAPHGRGNLLPNGSFEVGTDRWGILIRESGSPSHAMEIQFKNPGPKIESEGVAHGDRYLRVDIPEKGRTKITSTYIQAQPGRYTISCWLAADRFRNVRIGIGSGYFQSGFKAIETVGISTRWRKVSIPVNLEPAPDSLYYLVVETSGKGTLKLDGASMRAGHFAGDELHGGVEVGFDRQHRQTVFFPEDRISLWLNAANHSSRTAALEVWQIDFWGERRKLLEESVGTTERKRFRIAVKSKETGYYRFVAETRIDGSVQDRSELAIAVVPRPTAESSAASPFGGHVRFNEEMLEYARMLGVKWLRMHPPDGTKWYIVEKKKGKFQFADEPIELAKRKGFSILGMLATSPRWASSAPVEAVSEAVGSFRSYPPKDMRDWQNYVFRTVGHYKGKIDHWEVWNEPDSGGFFKLAGAGAGRNEKAKAYARLLKSAYEAAKKANPKAVIVGGGANHLPLTDWTETIFRQGAGRYVDVLSIHNYTDGRPGDALPTPTAFHLEELLDLMKRYGMTPAKKIWETESGIMYPATGYTNLSEVSPKYPVSGEDAAVYLVRHYVHLLSNSVDKWFYYHLFVSHQSDRREGAGFFEWDGSPRPLAAAYAVLSRTIGDCSFVEKIRRGSDVSGAVFQNKEKKVTVLWQNSLSPDAPVLIPVEPKDNVLIADIMGKTFAPDRGGRGFQIPVLQYPVYITERLADPAQTS